MFMLHIEVRWTPKVIASFPVKTIKLAFRGTSVKLQQKLIRVEQNELLE